MWGRERSCSHLRSRSRQNPDRISGSVAGTVGVQLRTQKPGKRVSLYHLNWGGSGARGNALSSTKPSLIVLISSFGVATRCGYVTPNFSTVLPIQITMAPSVVDSAPFPHRREFHILAVPFRGSLALLCAACRTFVDTLVLLCGFFAYYMASYLLYILPPDRAGPSLSHRYRIFIFFLGEPHGSGAGFRLQQRQHQSRTMGTCRTTQQGARQYVARGTARPKHGWAMEYTNSSWPGGMRSNKHKR